MRSGPRPPAVRRGILVVAVLGVLVLCYVVVSALAGRPDGQAYLDVASAEPGGTRALAEILRARGIIVSATDNPSGGRQQGPNPGGLGGGVGPAGAGGRATLVVVHPGRLTHDELIALLGRVWQGADVVLVAPDATVLGALNVGVVTAGSAPSGEQSDPRCLLPEATTAGTTSIGADETFTRQGDGAGLGDMAVSLCYGDPHGEARLAVLTPTRSGSPRAGGGRLVLLGSAGFLTNEHLGRTGNAALALGLLARQPVLSWITPDAGGAGGVGTKSMMDLLPSAFWWTFLHIVVVLALLALWRGRRLGPPVPEPLPVVVRAAETVEGRGRLYAAAHARDRTADALRAGTRVRLAERMGLPLIWTPAGSLSPDPVALVTTASEQTGRSPSEIGSLLYGSGMPPQTAGPPGHLGRARDWYQSGRYPAENGQRAASGGAGRYRDGGSERTAAAGVPRAGVPRAGVGAPRRDTQDAALLALAHALDELDRQVGIR
ncbi:hypothetical protein CcI156_06595 [Frankia sp. CcI156]|uniref:DUF4350 domain-containing protein n=1 Tax=Frankia casuarinae (strain DSM 45818 / CECT 9043 / HFP020203 / CcI3) TaxID=106370 RepID=Q2JEZ8_FRACC|nr:conserved hypothetical protein [Frankia casuarinae]OHV47758.1 hypothetical protein CgIS1_06770 [Frankia sp. CgIS1]ONH27961.1 hypothetical protein CcI156_06595 [Frankia sp. CcI156]ORT55892.1 hypothetical protein KBI5_01975 [Frankia sp. KB5]